MVSHDNSSSGCFIIRACIAMEHHALKLGTASGSTCWHFWGICTTMSSKIIVFHANTPRNILDMSKYMRTSRKNAKEVCIEDAGGSRYQIARCKPTMVGLGPQSKNVHPKAVLGLKQLGTSKTGGDSISLMTIKTSIWLCTD